MPSLDKRQKETPAVISGLPDPYRFADGQMPAHLVLQPEIMARCAPHRVVLLQAHFPMRLPS